VRRRRQFVSAQDDKKDDKKTPNILVIFGDDMGQTNVSAYSMGVRGYRTPNVDRIAREGMMFTDDDAEQSCTAGRSSFITGQCRRRGRRGGVRASVRRRHRPIRLISWL
jgi:arylsulfatase A-like enzyme